MNLELKNIFDIVLTYVVHDFVAYLVVFSWCHICSIGEIWKEGWLWHHMYISIFIKSTVMREVILLRWGDVSMRPSRNGSTIGCKMLSINEHQWDFVVLPNLTHTFTHAGSSHQSSFLTHPWRASFRIVVQSTICQNLNASSPHVPKPFRMCCGPHHPRLSS